MEPSQHAPQQTTRRRGPSGSGGIFGRFPFMKTSAPAEDNDRQTSTPTPAQQQQGEGGATIATITTISSSSSSTPLPLGTSSTDIILKQQQRTRRRRGSLRKVALLGRGAQRSRRGTSPSSPSSTTPKPATHDTNETPRAMNRQYDALGLGSVDLTPRAFIAARHGAPAGQSIGPPAPESSATYSSTTDEDDMLQLPHPQGPPRRLSQGAVAAAAAAAKSSYYVGMETQRRRSFHQVKSPLSSYNGLATAPGQSDSDWDYSDTEWWGWVVLIITWLVFVVGMGSCLDIWSWAWDVGKTPYAPPELEDDPTLPIVGYYPCLIILTCVMAWVWVVVAWVGMKHFRHAKISGD